MEQSGWNEVPDFNFNAEGRISMFWRLFDSDSDPLAERFLDYPREELAQLGVDANWGIETMVANHGYRIRWRKGRLVAILLHEEQKVLLSIVKLAPEPGDIDPELAGG